MKAAVIACVLAMALTLAEADKNAEVLRNDYNIDPEAGTYQADMETSNGIRARSSGISYPGNEPETGSYFVEGEYAYTGSDGQQYVVKYTADEEGYKPEIQLAV